MNVTMLLNARGQPISVYEDENEARAKCDAYNADPYVDGEIDVDAPYTVETWRVR